MALDIHPTAIVYDGAFIGGGSTVGPYSVIGPHVRIGEHNRIGPHVVIEGHTTVGNNNCIYQFASIGAPPQDLKYKGEDSRLEIGDRNIIREYVTLQPGTLTGGMLTKIGDQNLFMACAHVGHDVTIGSSNVIANSAAFAGHVSMGNRVTIGGLVGLHQHIRVGDLTMLGAGAMVPKDVPPFCIAQGDRAGLVGVNRIGLERAGYSSEEVQRLRSVYRALFFGEGQFRTRLEKLLANSPAESIAHRFLHFIMTSERGVLFPRHKEELD